MRSRKSLERLEARRLARRQLRKARRKLRRDEWFNGPRLKIAEKRLTTEGQWRFPIGTPQIRLRRSQRGGTDR